MIAAQIDRMSEFYNQYSYLKSDSEKNGREKFCDGVKSVGGEIA